MKYAYFSDEIEVCVASVQATFGIDRETAIDFFWPEVISRFEDRSRSKYLHAHTD